jgi:hypothetical protein
MLVNAEGTSRQSPICTGEVELLEFLAQRRACDDRDREIVCSDVGAVVASVRMVVSEVTEAKFPASTISLYSTVCTHL